MVELVENFLYCLYASVHGFMSAWQLRLHMKTESFFFVYTKCMIIFTDIKYIIW
jgi:hypothetical protein